MQVVGVPIKAALREPKKQLVPCSTCDKKTWSNDMQPLCESCTKIFDDVSKQNQAERAHREKRNELIDQSVDIMRRAVGVNGMAVDVIDELMRLHEGPAGFARDWYDEFQVARAEKPGSALVLRTYQQIATYLREVGSISEQQLGSIQDMELEETEAELKSMGLKVHDEAAG